MRQLKDTEVNTVHNPRTRSAAPHLVSSASGQLCVKAAIRPRSLGESAGRTSVTEPVDFILFYFIFFSDHVVKLSIHWTDAAIPSASEHNESPLRAHPRVFTATHAASVRQTCPTSTRLYGEADAVETQGETHALPCFVFFFK